MIKHYNIKVFGRVQGVGFRYSTREIAKKMNIKGFVKNQYDGSVYIEAEAEEINIQNFINWCKQGPSYARVNDFQITEDNIVGFENFVVK